MHHSFALEHLEGRALFSVLAPMDTEPTTATTTLTPQVTAASQNRLAGAFNVAGTYTRPISPGNPDAGSKYDFDGKGRNASLGRFRLSGEVQTPGFIASGRARGQLVLSNGHGTLSLSVIGPPQAPGSLPPSLTYRIRSGTGAYVNSSGKGHMAVSASNTTHKFLFRFNQATT